MIKTTLALALFGCASAQVDLTTANNDAQFGRQPRQTVNAFMLSQQVESLIATVSNQATELSLLRSADSPIALGVQAVAADMASRTQGLTATAATNAANIASMQSGLDTTLANVNTQLAAAAADLATQAAGLSTSVSTSVASMSDTIDARIAAATDQMGVRISAMNASLNTGLTLVAGKLDGRVNLWSGGCSNRGGSGWAEFCLNVVHFDTSAPKFARKSGSRFHALVHGIFTIDFRVISESCNWAHTLIYVAGRHWLHMNDWQGTGHWQHKHAHLTHKIAARQEFWARKYSGCWNAWHVTDNSGHARITAKWDGEWNGQG